MPLEPPALVGRNYAELLGELLRRIAVEDPEWTDFNQSDPGITLVELFAFLTESLLWHLDERRRIRRRRLVLITAGAAGIGLVLWRTSCKRPDNGEVA